MTGWGVGHCSEGTGYLTGMHSCTRLHTQTGFLLLSENVTELSQSIFHLDFDTWTRLELLTQTQTHLVLQVSVLMRTAGNETVDLK